MAYIQENSTYFIQKVNNGYILGNNTQNTFERRNDYVFNTVGDLANKLIELENDIEEENEERND